MKHLYGDSYIVRVYRRRGKASPKLVGTVEQAGGIVRRARLSGGRACLPDRQAFRDRDELWVILAGPKGRTDGKKRTANRPHPSKRTGGAYK